MNVPVVHEVHVDATYKSCSYLTENSLQCKDKLVNAVYFENREKCINMLCGHNPELFPVTSGDTKHCYALY
jgi:hypothetical protein